MKVKFLKTRAVDDGSGTKFEEGHVYDLPDASAQRWIRRNLAEPYEEEGDKGNPAAKFESAADTEKVQAEKAEADKEAAAAEKRNAKAAKKSAEKEAEEPAKGEPEAPPEAAPVAKHAPDALKVADIKKDAAKK